MPCSDRAHRYDRIHAAIGSETGSLCPPRERRGPLLEVADGRECHVDALQPLRVLMMQSAREWDCVTLCWLQPGHHLLVRQARQDRRPMDWHERNHCSPSTPRCGPARERSERRTTRVSVPAWRGRRRSFVHAFALNLSKPRYVMFSRAGTCTQRNIQPSFISFPTAERACPARGPPSDAPQRVTSFRPQEQCASPVRTYSAHLTPTF